MTRHTVRVTVVAVVLVILAGMAALKVRQQTVRADEALKARDEIRAFAAEAGPQAVAEVKRFGKAWIADRHQSALLEVRLTRVGAPGSSETHAAIVDGYADAIALGVARDYRMQHEGREIPPGADVSRAEDYVAIIRVTASLLRDMEELAGKEMTAEGYRAGLQELKQKWQGAIGILRERK